MAFGDIYAFKTKTRNIAAISETDEYTYNSVTVVDLVLVGVSNGRRTRVPVKANEGAAAVNEVWNVNS